MITAKDIAGMIDHSLLKPQLSDNDILEGCRVAREYGCASVCARPTDLALVAKELEGADVRVSTVIGFPHGSNRTNTKAFESEQAMRDGARELDMVLNIGKLISGDFSYVANDIGTILAIVHEGGCILKVIFENCFLDERQKIEACRIVSDLGVDFAKTSTGYGTGGATIADLVLMRKYCTPSVRIKAAGGVRTLDDALLVWKVGASRFGATASKAIVDEAALREREGRLFLPKTCASCKLSTEH